MPSHSLPSLVLRRIPNCRERFWLPATVWTSGCARPQLIVLFKVNIKINKRNAIISRRRSSSKNLINLLLDILTNSYSYQTGSSTLSLCISTLSQSVCRNRRIIVKRQPDSTNGNWYPWRRKKTTKVYFFLIIVCYWPFRESVFFLPQFLFLFEGDNEKSGQKKISNFKFALFAFFSFTYSDSIIYYYFWET